MDICTCEKPFLRHTKEGGVYCESCSHWWNPLYGSKVPKEEMVNFFPTINKGSVNDYNQRNDKKTPS